MDKDRREAERSGDPIRYALELRRSGEERRAKRLLQDLAWDKVEAAELALDELYPLDSETYQIYDGPVGLDRISSNLDDLLGSLDPRLNKNIEEHILSILSSGIELHPDTQVRYEQWLPICGQRNILDRLALDPELFSRRLRYAEPLEEELDAIITYVKSLREHPGRDADTRLADLSLAWHIQVTGTSAQLQSWATDYHPEYWIERRAFAEVTGDTDFFNDETKDPPWRLRSLPPNEIYRDGTMAIYLQNFKDHREALTASLENPFLIVLYVNNSEYTVRPGESWDMKTDYQRAHVETWQQLVGDRVFSQVTVDFEYFVLWEHGEINEIMSRLAQQNPDFQALGFSKEYSVSFGAAPLNENWDSAYNKAKERQEEAKKNGVRFQRLNVL